MNIVRNFWDKVDRKVFLIGVFVCLFFVLWAVIWPNEAANTFNMLLAFFGEKFGWLYLLVVSFFVLFHSLLMMFEKGEVFFLFGDF